MSDDKTKPTGWVGWFKDWPLDAPYATEDDAKAFFEGVELMRAELNAATRTITMLSGKLHAALGYPKTPEEYESALNALEEKHGRNEV